MILFLDACALIYRFEGNAGFRAAITRMLSKLNAESAVAAVAVSRLSVLECRVKPLRDGDAALLKRYDAFFAACHIVELSAEVVEKATTLRVHYALKTPDALQAAAALSLSADTRFVTGDRVFAKVAGLDVRLIQPPSRV